MLLAGTECLDWTHSGAFQVQMTEDQMGVSEVNLILYSTGVQLVESGEIEAGSGQDKVCRTLTSISA